MQLARFARARFCHLPTALEPLPRLTAQVGGPQILVKRDDATGLGFGGNKTRKLEFLIGAALTEGADALVTAGGVQSNHCRQTAAAAARHGLACTLVLQRRVAWNHPDYERGGIVLLDRLAGAGLHFVERDAELAAELERVADGLRAGGRRPFVIPVGGSTPVGALGYVAAGLELLAQAEAMGRPIDAILHASGSGGTQAGLLVALQALGAEVPVIGISVSEPRALLEATVAELAGRTAALLGTAAPPRAAVEVQDGYVGADYGQPTAGMREAVHLCAALEGLFLDPVYTGKAMAGLIDLIRRGRFNPDETVAFLHTGGTPALFPYLDALTE
ncbi:MAG TPA: D-cysteine desulfhydrase [Geminicoccaceae bacterium]|nr:D-cysteine desulfhydrase [Geminicoccaceae bacterium]